MCVRVRIKLLISYLCQIATKQSRFIEYPLISLRVFFICKTEVTCFLFSADKKNPNVHHS